MCGICTTFRHVPIVSSAYAMCGTALVGQVVLTFVGIYLACLSCWCVLVHAPPLSVKMFIGVYLVIVSVVLTKNSAQFNSILPNHTNQSGHDDNTKE